MGFAGTPLGVRPRRSAAPGVTASGATDAPQASNSGIFRTGCPQGVDGNDDWPWHGRHGQAPSRWSREDSVSWESSSFVAGVSGTAERFCRNRPRRGGEWLWLTSVALFTALAVILLGLFAHDEVAAAGVVEIISIR